MKKVLFEGVGTALITPFDYKGNILWNELEALIEDQIANGVSALVICGTTGEASAMGDEERIEVIRFAVEKVKGRIPVIAGTGSNNTKHSTELSLKARDCGADALLLVTPYYNKTSQNGFIAHFTSIADAVRIPCIVYNVPGRTGCNILPETYQKLSENEFIFAVKEANGDVVSAAKTLSLCGDNLTVYSGEDNETLPITALGGKGVISVYSNAFPRVFSDYAKALLSGDFKQGRAFSAQNIDLMDGFFMDVNPIPIKEALYRMGKISTPFCRLPLVRMSEEKQKTLCEMLKSKGVKLQCS